MNFLSVELLYKSNFAQAVLWLYSISVWLRLPTVKFSMIKLIAERNVNRSDTSTYEMCNHARVVTCTQQK